MKDPLENISHDFKKDMGKWNCLVNHGGNPCTCFDFKSGPSDELSQFREVRDILLKENERLRQENENLKKANREWAIDFKEAYSKAEGLAEALKEIAIWRPDKVHPLKDIAEAALSDVGSEIFGIPVKVDHNLKPGEWRLEKGSEGEKA